MAEKLKNHLRHTKVALFKTLRKRFNESKPSQGPFIWYQNLGFLSKINIFKKNVL